MKRIFVISACILCLFFLSGCFVRNYQAQMVLQEAELAYITDGDTIGIKESDGNVIAVRLIGIDAPESVAPESYTEKTGIENSEYGGMSAEHLKELLDGVHYVYLEYDQERVDSYDRILAYVYLDKGGDFTEMVNVKMLSDGYATTMEIEPNTKYAEDFREVEKYAKDNDIGLWAYDDYASSPNQY